MPHSLPCEAGEGWGGGKRVFAHECFAPIPTFPRKRGKEKTDCVESIAHPGLPP
jgi:hypothetical protein